MAQLSISRAVFVAVLIVVLLTASVSAQDSELAPAPSPTTGEPGAGFAVTVSGGFLVSTLFCSLAALLLH